MKKILSSIWNNILLISTLFLLAFIPLYPKLPIVDVPNTWVYVRVEDFIVAGVLTLWVFLVLKRKVKLKTPLTIPIFIFWIIGAISTFHGVLILFPTLANIFSNVAFLSLIRRIEYMSLFFIAFASIRDKKSINKVIWVMVIVLVLVILYGVGQKFLGFPAFLTGNEEFAKGVALRVSHLGRIPSTFAGHYDLAAYLVLIMPILISLVFGFKNVLLKISLLLVSFAGFGLLSLTASRVSFFVLLISLLVLLILHGKKILIFSLLILATLFLIISPNLLSRFQSTISEVNVLVNAKTGIALGQVKEVSNVYFKDKTILRANVSTRETILATPSATILYSNLSPKVDILMQPNVSTGENLPQGTGYVNLPMSPTVKRIDSYLTEKTIEQRGKSSAEVRLYEGLYLVKRAKAYDLSFTTRFQGEWPKTIDAFLRNVFIGSGYGSVSLAVDNDYLRILGESGLFGFLSFVLLFLISGIYIVKSLPKVQSPVVRSFVLGFVSGTLGLMLNGLLIDVFEASKVAFSFWILMGVTLGTLNLYNPSENFSIFKNLKIVLTSKFAVAVYFLFVTVLLFIPMHSNYFVGDDFTWFRWVSESKINVLNFFTESDGFFYRPGAKLYFFLMYKLFWLNQIYYHFVSIALHSLNVLLLFIILRQVLKSYILAIIGVIFFLSLSGYHEAIFWISSTGFLFTSFFTLLALSFFIYWKEGKNNSYLILSLISVILGLLFHELGVVAPLIIISYEVAFGENSLRTRLFNKVNAMFLLPLLPYLALRFIAGSHWFSGDYSYNMIKLPFNFIGNTLGYFILSLLGPQTLGIYDLTRVILRTNIKFAIFGIAIFLFFILFLGRQILSKMENHEKQILLFGVSFFAVALLPFLGLGNITSRYGYLSSIGLVIAASMFIRKAYFYLQSLGDKYISLLAVLLFTFVFLSWQLFQLQKVHNDWRIAGENTKRFLISFQSLYKSFWQNRKMNFYFVDVPIKVGDAWVFPVGLADSLWFSFKDLDFNVYQAKSLNSAFTEAKDPFSSSVFQIDKHGIVHEFERNSSGDIIEKK